MSKKYVAFQFIIENISLLIGPMLALLLGIVLLGVAVITTFLAMKCFWAFGMCVANGFKI